MRNPNTLSRNELIDAISTNGSLKCNLLSHASDEVLKLFYRSSFAKNQSKQEWPFLIDDKIHLFKVNSVFSTNNIDALQLLVEKGVGIGPIPYYSSQQLLNDYKIVELLTEYACIRADTFIFYKSGKHIPTRIRLFIDELSHYVSCLLNKF